MDLKDKIVLLQVLVLGFGIVQCLPNPQLVYPKTEEEDNYNFSRTEILNCLDLGLFMPGLNPETQKVECYPLATSGPCKNNEWFVLELNGPTATCASRLCQDINQVYYRENCLQIGSTGVCGPGMELLPTSYGFGDCECLEGFHPWIQSSDTSAACYQEHTQGPCPDLQQIANKDGDAVCEASNCPSNHLKWSDGNCYNNVECSEDGQINLDSSNGTLWCKERVHLRSLLVVPTRCDEGSELNSDNVCKATSDGSAKRGARLADSRNLARNLKLRLKDLEN